MGGRQWNPFDYLRPHRWNWRVMMRPLDVRLERQAAAPLTRLRVVGLRWFWLDGLFSTVGENFYAAFVPLFALAYGATKGQIGLLTAVANLMGMAAFFPGAYISERMNRRKPLVVWTGGGLGRIAVLTIAVSPLFVRDPALVILLLILLNGLRSFAGSFANPAWTAIVADLVPAGIRGRYFSGRNIAMAIAAMVVAPTAGMIIGRFDGNGVAGFQLVFGLAFVFGILGTLSFARIPEHGTRRVRADGRRVRIWALLRDNPAFVGFAISSFVWHFALQVAGPFFNVYIVTDLGGNTAIVGVAAAMAGGASLLGQYVFGGLLDRRGSVLIQRATGLIIPILPALWVIVTEPYQIYLIEAVAGFLWAGYNLASFNLLLELSPDADRQSAVALYQTVVFAAAVLGPLAGGYLSEAFGYRLVFATSAAVRFLGIGLFIWLVPRPGTRRIL
jgi:MFS family permease